VKSHYNANRRLPGTIVFGQRQLNAIPLSLNSTAIPKVIIAIPNFETAYATCPANHFAFNETGGRHRQDMRMIGFLKMWQAEPGTKESAAHVDLEHQVNSPKIVLPSFCLPAVGWN